MSKVNLSDNNNSDKSGKTDDENINSYKKIYNKFRNLSRKSQILIIAGVGVGVLLIILAIILLSLPQEIDNSMDLTSPSTTVEYPPTSPSTSSVSDPSTPDTSPTTTEPAPEPEVVAKLISRDEWKADEALLERILVPPKIVVFGDIKCSECDDVVRIFNRPGHFFES